MSFSGGGGGEGGCTSTQFEKPQREGEALRLEKNEKKWKMDDHESGYHITTLLFVAVSSFDEKRDCL